MHFNQDDINTGERLRGIRESMKMNREEFSEKIDITDSFLGQIERGERALSVKTLRKVVKYTGVSADYLLFGKDTNNETIQKINNILTVNSAETSDFIYHIVMYSNDFCKKLNKEQKIDKIKQSKKEFFIIDTSNNPKENEYEELLKKEGLYE